MSYRSNILLKRTVIISMVSFSLFITAGLMVIFKTSSNRDAEHIRLVALNGNIESQILRSRLLLDDIVLRKDYDLLPRLAYRIDSVHINLDALKKEINSRYDDNSIIDIDAFNSKYDTILKDLEKIEAYINSHDLRQASNDNYLFNACNSFNINFNKLQSMLPGYLRIDNVRYKREIVFILSISLVLIFFAGFFSIKLINKLIGADRALIRNTIEVESRERERIAADLHDSFGSLLSSLLIYVRVLEKEVDKDSDLMDKIKHLNNLANTALISIEEVINNLNPGVLSRLGLIKALEKMADKFNKLGKTHFTIDAGKYNISLPESTELVVYRICSELMTNAIKHSEAEDAELLFSKHRNDIKITYRDNGVGFDPEGISFEVEKSGIYNIIRRVESLEGNYKLLSKPGKGVEIIITFKKE